METPIRLGLIGCGGAYTKLIIQAIAVVDFLVASPSVAKSLCSFTSVALVCYGVIPAYFAIITGLLPSVLRKRKRATIADLTVG